MYRQGKWAEKVLSYQLEDGSFGYFHTLSMHSRAPITTEQALRRLTILGFTARDEPIRKACEYLAACLCGEKTIPDNREKWGSWDLYVELMLSAWLNILRIKNERAEIVTKRWARVVAGAFASGEYSHADYVSAYAGAFGETPRGGRLIDFVTFYTVALLADALDERTERAFIKYVIDHEPGIYYTYNKPVRRLPDEFCSLDASRYLSAVELLSGYRGARAQLGFVADWLKQNRNERGAWDMGPKVKDGVFFPYSDSWRSMETREADCTRRISKLLTRLEAQ